MFIIKKAPVLSLFWLVVVVAVVKPAPSEAAGFEHHPVLETDEVAEDVSVDAAQMVCVCVCGELTKQTTKPLTTVYYILFFYLNS